MKIWNTSPLPCRVLVAMLTLAALLPAMATVRAEDPDGGAAGDWLARYAGARSAGMGGAFVAVADDPSGALWNPAGVVRLDRGEVLLGTVRLFESTSVNGLSFGLPNRSLPSFGLTLLSLQSDDFERTSDMNEPLGTFNVEDIAFLANAAKAYGPLSVGAGVRVVRQSVEDYSATGTGLDLGAIYAVTPDLQLGASLLNLGGPQLTLREAEEKIPTELRAGAALRLLKGSALVTAEIDHREGPGAALRAGGEMWLVRSLALRLGYDTQSLTGGFGYRFPSGLQVDYAASDHELGLTHRVSLSFRFGGFYSSSQAAPEVFSPTGQQPVTRILLAAHTRAEAKDWALTIRNKSEEVVRRFGGQGMPPAHVLWDGKNEAGLPQPDGIYRYQLVVKDVEGNICESREQTVEIYTGGPQGAVPVIVE
jgi:hypothetical protein